jgi:type I restriction-modification system DNA methylase subunit
MVSTIDLEGLQREELARLSDKLIDTMAATSGTYGGEFYTPMNISTLMVGLLNPEPGDMIYDPACGTGSFLLAAHRHAQTKVKGTVDLVTRIVGQDINAQTSALAQMNVFLHDVPSATIESGNSLLRPLSEQVIGKGFDIVLSIPPIGMGHDQRTLEEIRSHRADFRYGPPTRIADFNFIQHALAALKETGRAALLVGLRPFFIRGQEGEIRRALIESDVVEAVIVLPENLLPHTRVPSAVLMLNKNKPEERRGHIRFVDASREFSTEERRRILTPENQAKIIGAVMNSEDLPRFAATISIQEVTANDFVLLPARYIGIEEVEVVLGSDVEWVELALIANVLKGTKLGQYAEGNVPVLQGRDLSVLGLQVDDLEKKDVPSSQTNVVRSQVGDLLVQRIGQKPQAFLVEDDLAGVIVTDTVYVVRFHEDNRPRARYIVEFLNSDIGQAKMTVSIAGAVVPTLRVTGLRGLRIPLPNQAVIDLVEDLHEVEVIPKPF